MSIEDFLQECIGPDDGQGIEQFIYLIIVNNVNMSSTIELIDSYLQKCDSFLIKDGNPETIKSRKELISEIVSTFGNDIQHISSGLTMYPGIYYGQEIKSKEEFTEDIRKLKSKLELYKCKLLDSQDAIVSTSNDALLVNNNISLSNNIHIQVDIYSVMKSVDELDIDSDSKSQLKKLLLDADSSKNNDLRCKKDRIVDVVKFALSKGADALITILPYVSGLV